MRFERAGPRMFPWGMGEILNYSSDESTEIVLKDGRGRGGQVEGICLGGAGGGSRHEQSTRFVGYTSAGVGLTVRMSLVRQFC